VDKFYIIKARTMTGKDLAIAKRQFKLYDYQLKIIAQLADLPPICMALDEDGPLIGRFLGKSQMAKPEPKINWIKDGF
jgi:hypothetical protein